MMVKEGVMTREKLMENISMTLKLMQDTYKVNSEELAKRVGITSAAISQIRSCKRLATLPLLTKIAKEFDLSLDVLTGYNVPQVEHHDGQKTTPDSVKVAAYRTELFAIKADIDRFLDVIE
jgi:transcriptional regulator with XRE-family HTH domain